ncbi:hypothetical protein TPHV1_210091 [Treponema phagedenis]|uniref:Uncharacterized protein n=1 Tax=Treponema phagedenis TaxID=162 RepID=A0A0B7GTN4_TREPH|nr:hypothetical protein TPHV1_210091 [Treponema phagedenis]
MLIKISTSKFKNFDINKYFYMEGQNEKLNSFQSVIYGFFIRCF